MSVYGTGTLFGFGLKGKGPIFWDGWKSIWGRPEYREGVEWLEGGFKGRVGGLRWMVAVPFFFRGIQKVRCLVRREDGTPLLGGLF